MYSQGGVRIVCVGIRRHRIIITRLISGLLRFLKRRRPLQRGHLRFRKTQNRTCISISYPIHNWIPCRSTAAIQVPRLPFFPSRRLGAVESWTIQHHVRPRIDDDHLLSRGQCAAKVLCEHADRTAFGCVLSHRIKRLTRSSCSQ